MKRTVFLAGVAALAFATPQIFAQTPANFAGKWIQVVDPNAPAPSGRGGRGGLGQEATIAQDAKTLTVTRTTQTGEVKYVYNLDGSDSKNTIDMRGNAIEQISQAKWDGNKLSITTHANFNGNDFTTTMLLSMDSSGNLVVQNTAPGRGGGEPTTTTLTYKKG